jgi:hypothetical protein
MCSDDASVGREAAGQGATPGIDGELGDAEGDGAAGAVPTDDAIAADGLVATGQDATTADASSEVGKSPDGASESGEAVDHSVPDVTKPDAASGDSPGEEASSVDACIPTGVEICTNGIDDDCNGLIDCADPACSSYSCIPPVPGGWTGPAALWQAMNPATAPACQNTFGNPIDANGGLTFSPASCGTCTCGASGQTCSAAGTFHPDQACNNTTCATVIPASDGSCTAVASNSCGSGGSFTMGASPPTPTGGSCSANAGSVSVPPVSWTTSARVCSYTGATDGPGGCADTGDLCVLSPTGSYGSTLCVYSMADPAPTSCPVGYTRTGPLVFYAADADTRGCGGCACAGAPSGGSCSGTVDLYGTSANGCSGTPVTYTVGAACQCYGCGGQPSLTAMPGYVKGSYAITAGTCAVTAQPTPTGTATPTGPTTLCCR